MSTLMEMDALVAPVSRAVEHAPAVAAPSEVRTIRGVAALDAALADGLHEEWRRLLDDDPLAGAYQSPAWCLPWYHAYDDSFEPFVVVVNDEGRIAGLVPMAIDRRTRGLVFAGNTMSDYRDIVARPARREAVVEALVRAYLDGRFRGPLPVGWIDPASDTPALLASVCTRLGLRYTVRQQPCWRWTPAEGENLQKKFSRIRTHLNHFKRQGEVTFDVVRDVGEWDRFREEFYRQHSLRQLQASREVSFTDARKQRLYDTLFTAGELPVHVTALRVNGRLLSGHVGVVWRDVLMLGAPSISLEDEHRSPAIVLMSWIMQSAASLGLAGFDFTVGDSEFKRRLGNHCVQPSVVEVFADRGSYYRQEARRRTVAVAKRLVEDVAGDGAWKRRIKPAAESLRFKWERASELGVAGSIEKAASYVPRARQPEVTYALAPGALHRDESLAGELHANAVDDLLACVDERPSVRAALTACARAFGPNRGAGHALYTLMDGNRLVAWCYVRPHDTAAATPAVLYDLCAAGGDAARWLTALVQHVASAQMGAGAPAVEAVVLAADRSASQALGALGFHIARMD